MKNLNEYYKMYDKLIELDNTISAESPLLISKFFAHSLIKKMYIPILSILCSLSLYAYEAGGFFAGIKSIICLYTGNGMITLDLYNFTFVHSDFMYIPMLSAILCMILNPLYLLYVHKDAINAMKRSKFVYSSEKPLFSDDYYMISFITTLIFFISSFCMVLSGSSNLLFIIINSSLPLAPFLIAIIYSFNMSKSSKKTRVLLLKEMTERTNLKVKLEESLISIKNELLDSEAEMQKVLDKTSLLPYRKERDLDLTYEEEASFSLINYFNETTTNNIKKREESEMNQSIFNSRFGEKDKEIVEKKELNTLVTK